MSDSVSKTTAGNGLVLRADEGGVLAIYPLQDGRIAMNFPNGLTVNLDTFVARSIHQFIGSWLGSAENAG